MCAMCVCGVCGRGEGGIAGEINRLNFTCIRYCVLIGQLLPS